MPVTRPSVRQLTADLLAKPKLERQDVDTLLKRVVEDGKLTSRERTQIQSVVDKFKSQGESKDAVTRLNSFLDIKSDDLRALATRLETNDGVIDASEAKKIVDIAGNGADAKFSLSAVMIGAKLTDEAKAVIKARIDGSGPTPPPAGNLVDIGLQKLDGKSYQLAADGSLTSGPAIKFDAIGALEMYRGAEALVATKGTPLGGLATAQKLKMLEFLTGAFDAGKDTGPLPEVSKQRIRSAAASTLLALIEGAKPADGDLKQKAVDLYLKQAAAEPLHGLRASMYFNMDRARGQLDAAATKRLDDLKLSVVPQKPPYEQWFADNGGKREINVVHYAHKDCWDNFGDPIAEYKRQGYTLVEDKHTSRPPRWVLEKTNNNAPGGAIKARIEVIQSHDGIFQKMDDKKTNVVLYTGHSNLGGNVSEELKLGPDEKGSKLVLLAMCRGKQNIHEVANKYPNSHFVTTDQPSYFSSVIPMAMGMIDGVMNMRDYEGMKTKIPQIMDAGGKDNYFFPNEARRYQYYDVDKDGLVDGKGAHIDKLFNITLRPPETRRTDGVVRPNDLNPRDIDGTNVIHATQFLNTVVTYHVDHGNNSSKFGNADMDNFRADGWFDGPASEKVRLKKNDDGTVSVQVNKGLCDQSWAVLGTIVQYEVAKQLLSDRNGGTLTKQDEARAMLFAGEYLSYMYCSLDEAEKGIAAIAKDAKFFKGTTFDELYRAVEADGHGYVTDAQMNALIRTHP